jgi:pimeloyl-ACP methyl ester carboxylesterase
MISRCVFGSHHSVIGSASAFIQSAAINVASRKPLSSVACWKTTTVQEALLDTPLFPKHPPATARNMTVVPQNVTIRCPDGISIAGQSWSSMPASSQQQRILCLHGWMDNCRSFHHLAPRLATSLDCDVFAMDFPGHGQSGHFSLEHPPTLLSDGVYHVAEVVAQKKWITTTSPTETNGTTLGDANAPQPSQNQKFTLIGHSMGAAVACVYAAAFPEQIEKLVLLDGAGPLARSKYIPGASLC